MSREDFDALVTRRLAAREQAAGGPCGAAGAAGRGARRRGGRRGPRVGGARWVACARRGWHSATGWPRWWTAGARWRARCLPGSRCWWAARSSSTSATRSGGRRAGRRAARARCAHWPAWEARSGSAATSRGCWGWPRRCARSRSSTTGRDWREHGLAPRRAARRRIRASCSGCRCPPRVETAEARRCRVRDAVLLGGRDPAAWPNAALALAHLAIAPGADEVRLARAGSVRGARRDRRARHPLPRRARPRPLATPAPRSGQLRPSSSNSRGGITMTRPSPAGRSRERGATNVDVDGVRVAASADARRVAGALRALVEAWRRSAQPRRRAATHGCGCVSGIARAFRGLRSRATCARALTRTDAIAQSGSRAGAQLRGAGAGS